MALYKADRVDLTALGDDMDLSPVMTRLANSTYAGRVLTTMVLAPTRPGAYVSIYKADARGM